MTKESRRLWPGRLGKLALVLLVLVIMLRWFEHRQTYHPSRTLDTSGADLGRAWEDVTFRTGDEVALNGWFFPANAGSPRARLAVLVCHGNGGNISHRLELARLLLDTGANVFLFDYRGYGRSEGRPAEEGTYRDAQAAHAWLRQKGFAATNIILFGESLGGGIASELALRETVGGLVLQSTFTSVTKLGGELFPFLPVRWIGSIRYDTHSKLPRIHVPVLIMHGRGDTLIRFHHAELNYAAANEPKLLCEVAGDHNDVVEDREGFMTAMEKFMARREARD